jgi:hypothetical protein
MRESIRVLRAIRLPASLPSWISYFPLGNDGAQVLKPSAPTVPTEANPVEHSSTQRTGSPRVDLRDDHVDVIDYSRASDVTISCDPSNIQQRLLEQGFALRE